jgi:hypothetical protein
MGRWVTLDDDQHVYISDGGKVLASRSAISKAGGAKERGKALAARSKGAITRNAFSAVRARSFFKSGEEKGRLRSEISQHLANREHTQAAQKSKQLTALEKKDQYNEEQAKGLAKDIIASHGKDALKEVGRRLDRSAQYDRSVQGKDWQPSQQTNNLVAAKEHVQKHFESATARAIDHARAAGPGQAREMARSQFKVAEKIRTGKMADAALKARYAREDALKAKLNAPKPAATPVRPKISEPPRTEPDAKGNFHVPDKQLAKAVSTGTSKEGMAKFSWDKPSTARAIEHAKAAGPSLREQADKGELAARTRVRRRRWSAV